MIIAFSTSVTRKISGKTILNEPLGGTHSAMINLAQNLSNNPKNQVYIFCNCEDEEGIYNNVNYQKLEKIVKFSKENYIDFYICVASESSLRASLKAKKTILWLHNDYSPYWKELSDVAADLSGLMATKSDKVITVSNWHNQVIKDTFKIPDKHLKVIYNGINQELFSKNKPLNQRKKHLIYFSAPDRGLDLILDFFPKIKEKVKDIELHIYSSFKTWGKTDSNFKEIENKILKKSNQNGVFVHEPLPIKELSEKLKNALLFVYPNHCSEETYFNAETFCISAVEAQACGLPVIMSNRGALGEVALNNETGFLIDGEPYSLEFKDKFISSILDLLNNTELWQKFSNNAFKWSKKFYYNQIVNDWENIFLEMNNEVSTRLKESPLKPKYNFPKVSIIIPTYNRANNLFYVLNSLVFQNFEEFEVIIADDGSTDNTREIVESFRNKLNIRYAFCGENQGFRAARTRNIGLSKARGQLIIFLDSDIVVPSNYIESHIEAHKKYNNIVVNTFVYRMKEYKTEDLGMIPKYFISKHINNLEEDSKFRFNIFDREPIDEGYYLDSNSLSIKAEHIKYDGFDSNFVGWGHEDTELGYRFINKGFKFLFIKEGCESYHIHHSTRETKNEEDKINWNRIVKKYHLKNIYVPLPSLEVEGLVILDNFDPEKTSGFYSNIVNSKFEIKLGDKFNALIPFKKIDISKFIDD
ncbi:MAG: glycosyltransferase [Candidatus Sericytochromatia bacterium]